VKHLKLPTEFESSEFSTKAKGGIVDEQIDWPAPGEANAIQSETDPREDGANDCALTEYTATAAAFIPAHLHKKAAEVLCILEGDFINENETYGSGDFLHSKPGTVHGPHTTKKGCSLLALYTANTGEPDPNDFFLAEGAKRS